MGLLNLAEALLFPGPAMCWAEATGAGHIPRWKLGTAQTDGLQSLDTTDRKLGGADCRSTQQAQPWNRQPIPGNEIFYSVQAPATAPPPDHSPMSPSPLILQQQQQLVHSLQDDGKVCSVARNAFQQSWGQRLQVESRLVGL